MSTPTISNIFVAGGQPSVTYVDRDSPDAHITLEEGIRGYLETGYKALTVTGPTKSGKTVLCRKAIGRDNAIWLSGGNIHTEDDFWDQLVEQLDIPESETATISSANAGAGTGEVSIALGIPGVGQVGGKAGGGATVTRTASKAATKVRSKKQLALRALPNAEKAVVIDDFHYIERPIQKTIVRWLKDPIFDGLRVVFIAVPHRAFDAVRSEREMTGRVDQVSVRLWSEADLRKIPAQGFPALNVSCDPKIVDEFVEQSLGSPHLMQEFCRQLCEINSVKVKQDVHKRLVLSDPVSFFKRIAQSTAKPAFDLLAQGPRQRSDRKIRQFVDGTSGDIYLAVLKAIAAAGAQEPVRL